MRGFRGRCPICQEAAVGAATQRTKVAVAVDARWRHQGGAAVEQFQRGEAQRRTGPGRTARGALVAKVLGIDLVQSFQRQRWPGAVTQQPLKPRAVGGREADRGVG